MLRRIFLGLIAVSLFASEHVHGVDAIAMTVADLDRSIDFYTKVLTFEKVSEYEGAGEGYERMYGLFGVRVRVARLQLGAESLELMQFLAPSGRPVPADAQSNDRWFQHVAIIVSDMDRAYTRLREFKVKHASPGPQRLPNWNKNAGGIQAFYFRDPDDHALEILHFPDGMGAEKWHRPTDKLFLGIDHTAIVVGDTDASIKFYRDALGFKVAGASENYGPEQERLNNVFGARLRITAIRAQSGPGIEFLEYLTPRNGRPYPADERPSDLIHWQTKLLAADAERLASGLREFRATFVTAGVIDSPSPATGYRKTFTVRDPDGHAVQLAEK